MFRIIPDRDLLNPDPSKRRRIKGIIVECGYECNNSCWCPHGYSCKYRSRYRWHNFSVSIRRFFYYHFHIDLPSLIYFQRHRVDLSGTTKCPHKLTRIYTCWDCKYSDGDPDGLCLNKERQRINREGRWKELDYPIDDVIHRRMCKLFEPNEYCLNYNKDTGERL